MSTVEISKLSKEQKDQMVVTYAALLLHDGGVSITEDKLAKVIKASGNQVEGYWAGLFAKALQGQDITDLIANVGGSAGAAAPAGGDAPAAAEAPKAAKKEEKVEEEEVDMDMGGLFGDDY